MLSEEKFDFSILVTADRRNTGRRGSVYRHVSSLYQPTHGRVRLPSMENTFYKTELFKHFVIVFLTGSYLDLSLFLLVEPVVNL